MKKTIYQKIYEIKKKVSPLVKDTKAYNYKYATLSQVKEKIDGLCNEQNIVVFHKIKNSRLITTVYDCDSGESLQSAIKIKSDVAQSRGSEITYYRRYNLLCLFDLDTEDDDGHMASKKITEKEYFPQERLDKLLQNKVVFKSSKEAIESIEKTYALTKEQKETITNLYFDLPF